MYLLVVLLNLNLYKFLSQVSVPCITVLSMLWCKLRAATFHFDKRNLQHVTDINIFTLEYMKSVL